MILQDEEIKKYIRQPFNHELIEHGRKIYRQHIRHVKGIGVDDFLVEKKMEAFERDAQLELRKRFAKPSTLPIYSKELATFYKALESPGTSRYYNAGSPESDKVFKQYLESDIGGGMNMRKWMSDMWCDRVNFDPMGVFLIDNPKDRNAPYVVYKSINHVVDMQFTGNKIEYLITKEHDRISDTGVKKVYRYMDDARFVMVVVDGETVTFEDPIINNIGYVPAMMLSTLHDVAGGRTTYIWESIGLGDTHLVDSSVHEITKHRHGFPKEWQLEQACRKCHGVKKVSSGAIDDKGFAIKIDCSVCNATGMARSYDVSDIIVKPPASKEYGDVGEVGGFITPDIESVKHQLIELDRTEQWIHMAIWSEGEVLTETSTNDTTKTATEVSLNSQAFYPKLNKFSNNAEAVEKFLTDTIGHFLYASYNQSVINYGRKYFLRSEYQAEQDYNNAKKAGLSEEMLDSYLEELIYVKFGSDPVELKRQLTIKEVAPFVHMTVQQVKEAGASQADYMMKLYFSDYLKVLEEKDQSLLLTTRPMLIREQVAQLNDAKIEEMSRGADVANAEAQAELRKLVGSMTAVKELSMAVFTGQCSEDAAVFQIVNQLGYTEVQARQMIGAKSTNTIPQQTP
jgi:hypothetical protein